MESGEITQPFEISLRRFGWSEVGAPLSQPYLTDDGYLEQYYENVLLYAPKDQLDNVRFRPLPEWMGIGETGLVERVQHEQLVFYEVENGLGHNVPFFFDRFIAEHGGRELSGNPTGEFAPFGDAVFRQCFKNYCLLYYANELAQLRVRMQPLGLQFLQERDPGRILKRAFNPETVQIVLEEERTQVGENEDQYIRVHVLRRSDQSPLYLVEGMLELRLPGRAPQLIHILPTDRQGISLVHIDPLNDLPAMTALEYEVCLNLPSDQPICSVDSFIYSGH
jgi:hypothetical protein